MNIDATFVKNVLLFACSILYLRNHIFTFASVRLRFSIKLNRVIMFPKSHDGWFFIFQVFPKFLATNCKKMDFFSC